MTLDGLPRLGVQLSTLRDSIKDLNGLIPRLAADGFEVVKPDDLAKLLADNGMVAPSGHVSLGRDGHLPDASLDALQAIGVDTAIVAFMPPDTFKDLDGVTRIAEKLAAAAQHAAARGMTLGYHNHFWELAPIDGRVALIELFERAGPGLVAEIDTYWAQVGGADPAVLVAELGERVRFLHVKDGPADTHESDMVAVGAGAIDVPEILSANPAV